MNSLYIHHIQSVYIYILYVFIWNPFFKVIWDILMKLLQVLFLLTSQGIFTPWILRNNFNPNLLEKKTHKVSWFSTFFEPHTVDGRNPANQLIWRIYHYFQGFRHPRWLAGFLNHHQYLNENLSRAWYIPRCLHCLHRPQIFQQKGTPGIITYRIHGTGIITYMNGWFLRYM